VDPGQQTLDTNLAASIIATTALATLFAVVGLLSLAAGLRWHERHGTARMSCCPPSWTRCRSSRTAGTPLSTMTVPSSRWKSPERAAIRDDRRSERA
jgi:hypothetical protein